MNFKTIKGRSKNSVVPFILTLAFAALFGAFIGCDKNKTAADAKGSAQNAGKIVQSDVKPDDKLPPNLEQKLQEALKNGEMQVDPILTQANRLYDSAMDKMQNEDYDGCLEDVKKAMELVKKDRLDFMNAQFHCTYEKEMTKTDKTQNPPAVVKLDFSKNKLPEDKLKKLRPLAEKMTTAVEDEMDAINVALVWLMLQDRKNCAAAFEKMSLYMMDSEDLSPEEKQQLTQETAAMNAYIMDEKNSYGDLQVKIGQALGF